MSVRLDIADIHGARRPGVVLPFDRGATVARRPLALAPRPDEPAQRDSLAALALRELALRPGLTVEDPGERVRLWGAFAGERLTVIDRFERDGRRYVLAVGLEPAPPAAPLTSRESQALALASRGHDDKHIAYELGLQPSSVASLLSRAARKLGAANRMDLIRRGLAGPVGAAVDGPPPGLRLGWLALDDRHVLVLDLPGAAQPGQAAPALAGLSEAERAVASLLLAGHRRAVIARMRGAALGTVHKQVECVYRKLGIGSRRELAARVFAGERR